VPPPGAGTVTGMRSTRDDDHVPDRLREKLRAFDDALAATRTRRMRLEQLAVPDVPGPTAADLDEAARRPGAPRELRDLARAVDEGRASWDDVLHPHAGPAAAEVRAYFEASPARFAALMARGEEEDRRRQVQGRGAP
jgi:hypothetical protein